MAPVGRVDIRFVDIWYVDFWVVSILDVWLVQVWLRCGWIRCNGLSAAVAAGRVLVSGRSDHMVTRQIWRCAPSSLWDAWEVSDAHGEMRDSAAACRRGGLSAVWRSPARGPCVGQCVDESGCGPRAGAPPRGCVEHAACIALLHGISMTRLEYILFHRRSNVQWEKRRREPKPNAAR